MVRAAVGSAAQGEQLSVVAVPQPETLLVALRAAMGIVNVVRKRREIYLWQNVRIHLDDVEGLGQFLEFEAVLSPEIDEAAGRRQLQDSWRGSISGPKTSWPGHTQTWCRDRRWRSAFRRFFPG